MQQPAVRVARRAFFMALTLSLATVAGCTAAPTTTTIRAVTGVPSSATNPQQSATRTTAPRISPKKPKATQKMTPSQRSTPPPATPRSQGPAARPGSAPVIVLDPGHAPTIRHTDPATGLNDSDYENEPEMQDVFDVAQLVRTRLIAAGYRVVMTKNAVHDRVSLGQRAAIANSAHAALALSIHDQAGSNGGIGFDQGNNIVYYQAVGDYRQTPAGAKIEFTDGALAATSLRYGKIFRAERQAAQGAPVRLQGSTGYDLGSRGLAAGDIWIVQLLSKVPWIYNEAGGNSAGRSGLNAADKQRYADGLVAAVEQCVPAR